MIAVITGDIINSRKGETTEWLPLLKEILSAYGAFQKNWEIFRGDSFQLSLSPDKALLAAIHIKAGMKFQKELDARLAIGIGEEDHNTGMVTEANGTAYIRSGECFEALKKQNLAIRTGEPVMDELLNLLFSLALLTMDNWSPLVADVIRLALENPDKNQKELAELLKRSPSSVNEALKRGGYDEVMEMNEFYKKQVVSL